MKLRYVAAVVGGTLLTLTIASLGIIAKSSPKRYGFLEGQSAKYVALQPDPIGLIGREERYYLLHQDCKDVTIQAEAELTNKGWHAISTEPKIFGRGPHERIEIQCANNYKSERLLKQIPPTQRDEYTVVRVLDPHMPPAMKRRLANWVKRGIRMNG